MGDIVTRKCACCKGEIEIDVDDVRDVVYFDKLYYHKSCFEQLVAQKAANKRCSPKWKAMLGMGLKQLEKDAEQIVSSRYGHDKLFDHMLFHYDIYTISTYTQKLMDNVVNGQYKGKSKPISYRDFADCWVDMQPDLDSIYKNNQRLGKNMTSDQRINYDLAVVVRTYPEWKKRKIRAEAAKKEAIRSAVFDEIDMSKIGQGKQVKKKDISNISDDIFVE